MYDIPLKPIGNILVSVGVVVMAYAIVRYRLMDIHIPISKTLYSLFILIPLIVFQILFASLLHSYGVSYIVSNSLSVLAIVAFFLFTPVAYKLRDVVKNLVLGGRYDYQKVLRESIGVLVKPLELQQLLNYIILSWIIVQNLDFRRLSLLLEDREKGGFRIEASYSLRRELVRSYVQTLGEGIILCLRKRPKIFILDEIWRALPRGNFESVYGDLSRIGDGTDYSVGI